MRIRQVRPEFFTDSVVGHLTPAVRLTYIGLWCVADDAGWLEWDVHQIAVQLYPYESVRVREGRIEGAAVALVAAGRMVMHECGCAVIPKLSEHQKIGGNKSFAARDAHQVHTRPDLYPGKVGYGMVGNGRVNARASANGTTTEHEALMDSYRRQGLPVDVA
jgi:hypothetical protein